MRKERRRTAHRFGTRVQGSPLSRFRSRTISRRSDDAARVRELHAMAVGNHEYNLGLKVSKKARREAKFPGSRKPTTSHEAPHYKPYLGRSAESSLAHRVDPPGVPTGQYTNYAVSSFIRRGRKRASGVPFCANRKKRCVVHRDAHGLSEDLARRKSQGQVPPKTRPSRLPGGCGVDVIFMATRIAKCVVISTGFYDAGQHWGAPRARRSVFAARGHWLGVYAKRGTRTSDDRVEPEPRNCETH